MQECAELSADARPESHVYVGRPQREARDPLEAHEEEEEIPDYLQGVFRTHSPVCAQSVQPCSQAQCGFSLWFTILLKQKVMKNRTCE